MQYELEIHYYIRKIYISLYLDVITVNSIMENLIIFIFCACIGFKISGIDKNFSKRRNNNY